MTNSALPGDGRDRPSETEHSAEQESADGCPPGWHGPWRDGACVDCGAPEPEGERGAISDARISAIRIGLITGSQDPYTEADVRRLMDAVSGLRAEIKSLADEAAARKAAYPSHPHWAAWDAHEGDLRGLISSPAKATSDERPGGA